jgi:hypothetical protein
MGQPCRLGEVVEVVGTSAVHIAPPNTKQEWRESILDELAVARKLLAYEGSGQRTHVLMTRAWPAHRRSSNRKQMGDATRVSSCEDSAPRSHNPLELTCQRCYDLLKYHLFIVMYLRHYAVMFAWNCFLARTHGDSKTNRLTC